MVLSGTSSRADSRAAFLEGGQSSLGVSTAMSGSGAPSMDVTQKIGLSAAGGFEQQTVVSTGGSRKRHGGGSGAGSTSTVEQAQQRALSAAGMTNSTNYGNKATVGQISAYSGPPTLSYGIHPTASGRQAQGKALRVVSSPRMLEKEKAWNQHRQVFEQQIKDLQEQRARANREASRLSNELGIWRDRVRTNETKWRSFEAERLQNATEAASREAEIERLLEKMDRAIQKIADQKAEITRLTQVTEQCADLQQEIADMGSSFEKLVAKKKELERILTAREQELEIRGLAMQKLTLRGKEDEEELERLGAERDNLIKELEASKSREADLRAQRRLEVEVRESKERELLDLRRRMEGELAEERGRIGRFFGIFIIVEFLIRVLRGTLPYGWWGMLVGEWTCDLWRQRRYTGRCDSLRIFRQYRLRTADISLALVGRVRRGALCDSPCNASSVWNDFFSRLSSERFLLLSKQALSHVRCRTDEVVRRGPFRTTTNARLPFPIVAS